AKERHLLRWLRWWERQVRSWMGVLVRQIVARHRGLPGQQRTPHLAIFSGGNGRLIEIHASDSFERIRIHAPPRHAELRARRFRAERLWQSFRSALRKF